MSVEKIRLTKIASVTKALSLPQEIEISSEIIPEEGIALVVQALEERDIYGELELIDGKSSKIQKGDLIAGVLGRRQALKGFVGEIPHQISVGDTIHILNIGGVLGSCVSGNLSLGGMPIGARVLGSIILGREAAQLKLPAGPKIQLPGSNPGTPLVFISGTGMDTGKTAVAESLIRELTRQDFRIAAGKLTGVAAQKDLASMQQAGAQAVAGFWEFGLPSTVTEPEKVVRASHLVITQLLEAKPDLVICELGDGILGWYGVDTLLTNVELMAATKFFVVCANDLVGACGAYEWFRDHALTIDFFAGPVAASSAGVRYLEKQYGIPTADVRVASEKLVNQLTNEVLQR